MPNLYPVLGRRTRRATAARRARRARRPGLASSIDPLGASTRAGEPDLFALAARPTGAHEVIVHAPEHATSLAELDDERFAGAVAAWRERMRAHADDAAYVHLIVNEGPDAGASLEHTHAQLYALRLRARRGRPRARASRPPTTSGRWAATCSPTSRPRRCAARERLVAIDDEALLVCPWASRSPFELRVIPRRPAPSFEDDGETGTAMIRDRARAPSPALFGSSPQLNLWVRTAPRGAEEFCWHVDVVPRLTVRAGFELGTGVEVNVYPPERAAADLREALGGDRVRLG